MIKLQNFLTEKTLPIYFVMKTLLLSYQIMTSLVT